MSIPEYQLALADPKAFTRRMDYGDYRYFHECDDVAHYCGIVVEDCSEANVFAMRSGRAGPQVVRTLWSGPAMQLLKDTKVVRPKPYWSAPIDQGRIEHGS